MGLSGPLFYDYENMLNRTYPNPVLEAPLGLMVLYDEIVFLHEVVCPKTMQKLDFVRFLSDSKDIKDYFERIEKEKFDEYSKQDWQSGGFPFDEVRTIKETIAPFARWDNHSRTIVQLAEIGSIWPDSARTINVLLDNLIAHDENFWLITNSAIDKTLSQRISDIAEGNLANIVLSNHIPNYLTKNGPYVDTIYDIRDRPLLKQFRQKIDETIYFNDDKSLHQLAKQFEDEFSEIRNELAYRIIERTRIYDSKWSAFKAGLSYAADFIPGVSEGKAVYNVTKDLLDIWDDRNNYAWAGFLLNLEISKPSPNKSNR